MRQPGVCIAAENDVEVLVCQSLKSPEFGCVVFWPWLVYELHVGEEVKGLLDGFWNACPGVEAQGESFEVPGRQNCVLDRADRVSLFAAV